MDWLINPLENIYNQLASAVPNIVVALLLLLLAWVVAIFVRFLLQKGLGVIKFPALLQKGNLVQSEEDGQQVLQTISKIVYYLVFLLFLPSILDALNMRVVSEPISNMMSQFLNFLPNLFGAALTLVIGYIIAKLVRELLGKFLQVIGTDAIAGKYGMTSDKGKIHLSQLLATIVFVLILIPVVIASIEILNIEAISAPAIAMLAIILNMIPNIIVAILLVVIGYFIGKVASDLLTAVLGRVGLDQFLARLGFENAQKSLESISLSQVIGRIVHVVIVLFFLVEAFSVIQLNVLNEIGQAIIVYLPMLLSALIILGLGFFLSSLVERGVKQMAAGSILVAKVLKYGIITFAIFMALEQLGFATTIVQTAFILILGGLVLAFAISFGLGGREFASRSLNNMEESYGEVEKRLEQSETETETETETDQNK